MTVTTIPDGPVQWDDEIGAFWVTGFAEASAVLRGSGWSSDPRLSPLSSDDVKDMPQGSMLFADPPDHTRLRKLIGPAFAPKAIEHLRGRVAAIAEAVVDGLDDIGPEIDVLVDVGYPVALAVLAELFDIGVEGAELFAEQTANMGVGMELGASADDLMTGAVAYTKLTLFLTPLLSERERNPGDDFISALAALQVEPDGLTSAEVMASCILLLAAGHETTASLIANSTLALLEAPDQIPLLHANPQRAVEELLRLETAVKFAGRTALVDHDIGGQHIAAGQAVLVHLRHANRDPARFPDPSRMDLTRTPVGNLAFGAGPHFCLGATLGRLEVMETLTTLFRRFPRMRLSTDQVQWRESTTLHALYGLPVRLD
jgi:cytochrome P450